MSTPPLTAEQPQLLMTVGRGMNTLGADSINGLLAVSRCLDYVFTKPISYLSICPHR